MDAIAFSTSTTAIIGSGVTPVGQNLTIIRTHGYLEFTMASADAAQSGFNFAGGIGVVSADAFAVGIGSMPNPFDDISWPGWLWHKMGGIHTPAACTIGDAAVNMRWEIESKAMRKLGLNEVAFLAIQGGESVNSSVTVRGGTRQLLAVSLS